jgi:hypothetical protein
MIQRIQSIYLFLAGLSAISLFLSFMPLGIADSAQAESLPVILRDGVYNLNDNIILLILTVSSSVIAFLTIFLYKNRGLQMKIAALMMILSLGLLITAYLIYYQQTKAFPNSTEHLGLGIFSPVLSILFGSLANRSIRKDEKLVKSMDRLR